MANGPFNFLLPCAPASLSSANTKQFMLQLAVETTVLVRCEVVYPRWILEISDFVYVSQIRALSDETQEVINRDFFALLPGDGGNVRRAAEAGLLVRVSGTHQRQGQRGAENLLLVHRHEQAARDGSELRPGARGGGPEEITDPTSVEGDRTAVSC